MVSRYDRRGMPNRVFKDQPDDAHAKTTWRRDGGALYKGWLSALY